MMMMNLSGPSLFDVLILGGGPAGCAAAIELGRAGLAVAVLERSRHADDRIGNTLAPEAAPLLARLGVMDAVRTAPGIESPGILSLWGGEAVGETDFLFNPYGPGRHIERSRLDAVLCDAAGRAGATVVRGVALRTCRATPCGWVVDTVADGVPGRFTGRWVIDATGRTGWLLRRQGIKPAVTDRLVGVIARIDRGTAADNRLVLEAVPDGWWYYSPLPGGRAVAVFLTDSDLLPRGDRLRRFWDQQRSTSRLVGPHLPISTGTAQLRVVSASTQLAGTIAGPAWLAAGDAALAHDPLSGSGIRNALASGWDAARTILACESGDKEATRRYQQRAEADYRAYQEAQARVYGQVTDWPAHPFWRRRSFAPISLPLERQD